MIGWRGVQWLVAALLLGCTSPPATRVQPQMDPAPEPRSTEPRLPKADAPPVAPADPARRIMPPEEAWRRGLMPLASTGVPRFAAALPLADGRGVLIAILDSGIDPSVPGLQRSSDGTPKLLDLRDFSGEGRVPLAPVIRRGDTVLVGGRALLGASRIAALAVAGEWWGGVLDELPLGEAPAADLDGNGTVGDRLPVVVVRSASGWVLFADTQGNGSYADDRPIRDYSVAHEYFGWSRSVRPPATQIAVNLADSAGAPLLDLVFDTSSQGTHVAGIAAGHDLYGVTGFDGVAPGAHLLGLKIANDAQGGITVTGSMVRALAHAIRFAEERHLPLVVNISFGVGNEAEGAARIDAVVDSILAVHPDVVVSVAAANDGPALSTLGSPGSAARVLSVGATQPLVFSGLSPDDPRAEPVASFSSRGGELAGPDLVVPGTAYSSVPGFAIGNEIESGTSMAAPHASGLAARLLSAWAPRGSSLPAAVVVQALRTSATPLLGATAAEQGAGRPELLGAWRWLERHEASSAIAVDHSDSRHGRAAIWLTLPESLVAGQSLSIPLTIRRLDATAPVTLRLVPSAPWIRLPATVTLGDRPVVVTVALSQLRRPDAGAIRIEDPRDGGLLGLVPVTVRQPMSATALTTTEQLTIPAGGTARLFLPAESGRGFQVEVATASAAEMATASLHEPGGMPFRSGAIMPAGFGDGAALFELSGNDVVRGMYEVAVAADALSGTTARVTVRRAPLRLDAAVAADSLRVTATSLVAAPLSVRLRVGLTGGELHQTVRRTTDQPVRIVVPVPEWAERVEVDSRMAESAWPQFTDFGVTIQDRAGRYIDAQPLNYAFGRAAPALPPHVAGDSLVVLLSPAFAERVAPWELEVAIRFYAQDVIEFDGGGSAFQSLAPGGVQVARFPLGPLPRQLPAGFQPLVILVALEGDDHSWTHEVSLDPIRGPAR